MRTVSSNILYNAEAGSLAPEEVFELLYAQVEEELGTPDEVQLHMVFPEEEDNGDPLTKKLIHQELESINMAKALYDEHGEESFIAMQQSENEGVREIGKALETGEYGGLAI